MNMPLVLLNRRRRGGAAAFTPAGLFALAEPGVWYDPSDLTTLFQDTAGTTPVTTPGQTVALALDKSKGLVLGSELVTNGDFSGGSTGWTVNDPPWRVSGGVLEKYVDGTAVAEQTLSITSGKAYRVNISWTRTAGDLGIRLGANANNVGSISSGSSGTISVIAFAGADHSTIRFSANTAFRGSLDNISVKELPGFHATQATLASRPTYGIVPLGGRRNLLTRTEEFNDAVWTKSLSTISATNVSDPLGGSTADEMTATSAGGNLRQVFTFGAGNNVFSVWLRSTSPISTGIIIVDGVGGVTTQAISVTSDWTRFSVTRNASAGAGRVQIGDGSFPNGGKMEIWGAQLETGSSATAYQRVGSTFDVTEAGVASLSYLSFDGVDDFMVTPTITPGIDRAQVFAGVRKLSDPSIGADLVSTLDSAGSNAGLILINAPGTSFAAYTFASKGTAFGIAGLASNTFPAPITNVVTGLGDISGDRATLRVNGTQVAQATTDQGTGNFLAYPIYIGRRAGTQFPFNGQIYSLIVRFGTNLDAGTITSTETWVAGKTGVTL